jgi:Domain of unknown function (DUF4349)
MTEHRRTRFIAWGALLAVFAVVVLAFALGGHSSSGESAGASGSATSFAGSTPARSNGGSGNGGGSAASPAVASPALAPREPAGASASVDSVAGGPQLQSAVDAVTATRVVKTGSLDLQVGRGQVQATVTKLVIQTNAMGGYVSQSHTDSVAGSPTGELTLRIPASRFDTAVSGAEQLGHVVSLTTNAQDVTGRVVDLGARLTSLGQTRSTYLTILGHAKTVGATLEVQQRVDDVQQQIEELQGELKVLRNQSADGTLTVDVSQTGSQHAVVHHHKHNGIGAAWHRSISRFARGFDAIVGALGPLLLAILVLGVLAGIAGLGYRGVRRVTT